MLGPLLGGLAVLALFVWHEAASSTPASTSACSRTGRSSASVSSIALLFFGMGGVYFFTSFYLQNVRGYSPLEAGALAVPFALAQFLIAPRSAPLVDRFGVRAVGVAGMLLNAIAIGGWAFIGADSPIWIVALLFFVQGAGLGVAIPAATASVMQALPRERAGAGSALSNTARQVAVALSVAVLGSILAQAYRSSLSPTLAQAPGSARNAAGTSITATQALAQHLGPAGRFLLAPADASFVDAMRITTAIAAGLAIIGAIAVSRWMPGKPRPTIEEIEQIVAAEIAAAERDLAHDRPPAAEPRGKFNTHLSRTDRCFARQRQRIRSTANLTAGRPPAARPQPNPTNPSNREEVNPGHANHADAARQRTRPADAAAGIPAAPGLPAERPGRPERRARPRTAPPPGAPGGRAASRPSRRYSTPPSRRSASAASTA